MNAPLRLSRLAVLLGLGLMTLAAGPVPEGRVAILEIHPLAANPDTRRAAAFLREAWGRRFSPQRLIGELEAKRLLASEATALTGDSLAAAWRAYFELDLAEAAQAAAAVPGAEARLVEALVARGQGDRERMRERVAAALALDPGLRPDPKRFPPEIIQTLNRLRPSAPAKPIAPQPPAGETWVYGVRMPELDPGSLAAASRETASRLEVQTLLWVRLEPIGWNHKLEAWRFDARSGQLSPAVAVELVSRDAKTIKEGAELLLERLYPTP